MTDHADFNEIGKKTPYRIPADCFKDMQQKVMQRIEEPHKKRFSAKTISYAVIGIAATVYAFIFIPRPSSDGQEQYESISWIEQISDDDLQALNDLSEIDIFFE